MRNGINKMNKNKSPLKFFLIIYGLSIPLWLIETLIDVKGLPLDIPITDILAAFTPLVAASFLVYTEDGKVGANHLVRRIFDFSIITQKQWYIPIVLLPFLMYLLIYLIIYFKGLLFSNSFLVPFTSIPVYFIFFFLGAIAEEIGYMGYAFEPIKARFGALMSSIIIGILWAVWHYPSIIQQGHNAIWIAWGTLGTVAVRVLIVWLYTNTSKSIFVCILFHTLLNLGRILFPRDEIHNPLVDYPEIHYSIIATVAVFVVFLWGSKTLAHYRFQCKL
jgi:uncharacterized protein